ncbi:MAG: AraC family transcriptional regulator, partial [Prevotella sp.]|nr:AraC family transcriptional regulator [Prevotella sp.]
NNPVKQIAAQLGFEDVSYFVRLFRQHVGMPPKQYREV